ncbi:MAG: CDP-archaeol synthase [Deltaproteobacteria bacterium]|nr:CDP-archaeol synthase [Deltaproteobacteria bacterium]
MVVEMAAVLYFFGPAYAADVMPVLAKRWWPAFSRPVDGGRTFRGLPIFGSHKTWRGVVTGSAAGIVVYEMQAWLYGLGWLRDLAVVDYSANHLLPGILMAVGALAGDMVKSFFKRRIGIAPGASWLGFDQLDFFLGASLLVSAVQPLPLLPWLAVLPIVFAGDAAVCVLAYWVGLKDAPI